MTIRLANATFITKLFVKLIYNDKYAQVVTWNERGYLLIHNVKKFEEAVAEEGICEEGVGYDSIARQLRIYGFNRVVSKNHGFAVERDEKLWKHESLRAPCSLEDVRAIDRRAPARHPTRKSNASKNGKTTGKGCKGTKQAAKANSSEVVESPHPEAGSPEATTTEEDAQAKTSMYACIPAAGSDIAVPDINQCRPVETEAMMPLNPTATEIGSPENPSTYMEAEPIPAPLPAWGSDIAVPDSDQNSTGSSFDEEMEVMEAINSSKSIFESQYSAKNAADKFASYAAEDDFFLSKIFDQSEAIKLMYAVEYS